MSPLSGRRIYNLISVVRIYSGTVSALKACLPYDRRIYFYPKLRSIFLYIFCYFLNELFMSHRLLPHFENCWMSCLILSKPTMEASQEKNAKAIVARTIWTDMARPFHNT